MEKISPGSMRVGRGTSNLDFIADPNECLCYRPLKIVCCHNCGFQGWGRIEYKCMKHPMTRFLHDWPYCPNCRGYCLIEIS